MYKNIILSFFLSLFLSITASAQDMLPSTARPQSTSTTVPELQLPEIEDVPEQPAVAELTRENLLAALEKYEVKFPLIVLAQAILETGHFTSNLCMEANNLFGLRHPSDGSYYTFDNWEQSVIAYRDDIQYKYTGGDYYAFLRRIGYAQDQRYTSKVRKIVSKL